MTLFLAAALASATAPTTCTAELEAGRGHYGRYEVALARKAFARAAAEECPQADRDAARLELARIEWLVDDRSDLATTRLRHILLNTTAPCPAARLLGRILNASGQSAGTRTAVTPYLSRCAALEPDIHLDAIWADLDQAVKSVESERSRSLIRAERALAAAPPLARATLEAARLRLGIGLLSSNARVALDGWQSFLKFGREHSIRESSPAPVTLSIIANGVAAGAADDDQLTLARSLIRSGFDREAQWILSSRSAGAPAWREVRAYLRMRHKLADTLLSHDRAYAHGDRRPSVGLETTLMTIMREAVAKAGHPGGDLWPALARLWNLYGTTGVSNGVPGLHLGHVVQRGDWQVVQGPRRGRVSFVALDNMVANSFSGWLGDGQFGPGGWAANGVIVQVRPRYVRMALDRAAIAVPGPARERYEREMTRRAAEEEKAQDNAITYLPGVADRLRLKAVDALSAEVAAGGRPPATFQRDFAELWYARNFEGSILLHEGRHALDEVEYLGARTLSNPELEYRAKLSELRYSRSPRLLLSSIYGRLLGGQTGHGIANARLITELTAWMMRRADAIPGYKSDRPALLQIDLVSEPQLRAFATEQDPQQSGQSRNSQHTATDVAEAMFIN